jgi:ATP-dependent Clp protease ATP-binding subunit ClpA
MESRIELIAITSSMSRVKPKNQSPAFKVYFKEVSAKLDSYMTPEFKNRIDDIIKKQNNNC